MALAGEALPVGAVPQAAAGEEVSLAAAFIALLRAGGVKVGAYGTQRIRVVTHHQITDEHVERLGRCARAAGLALSPLAAV